MNGPEMVLDSIDPKPFGFRWRRNPRCETWLRIGWARCNRPATVRRTNLPYWSLLMCPEHAA